MDYLKYEDFGDIISDSSSTGYEDKFAFGYLPSYTDLQLPEADFLQPSVSDFTSDDTSITYLCEICHKNVIKLTDPATLRKKRKRTENQLIVASMKVCEECRNLDLEGLKKMSGSASCKRVIKREHAKRRAQESDLKAVKESQEKQIDENSDLNDTDKKRLKQVIRNRISAQQSRDRKKAYIREIEDENQLLKQAANNLKHKIQQLNQENQYLKNQLAQIHLGGSGHIGVKGAALGLATLLSVFVLVNSLSTPQTPVIRQLSTQLDLADYKNSDGHSLQQLSETLISEIHKEIQTISEPSSNSIVEYRNQRVDIMNKPQFLQKIDPCEKKFESSALTTLFCPTVQAYWENELEKGELKHLQVIIPLESLPVVEHTVADTSGQKYMIEILCSVNDLNVIPISSH